MDETTQNTGQTDAFVRLLAQLSAPTTDAVAVAAAEPKPPQEKSALAPAALFVPPVFVPPPGPPASPRAPEMMSADELAGPPQSFPRAPAPLRAPVAPVRAVAENPPPVSIARVSTAPSSTAPSSTAPRTPPSSTAAHLDFGAMLTGSAPSAGSASLAGPVGIDSGSSDEPNVGKSTIGEKIILLLAVLLPPIGLIAAIVAAIGSARRRGWVIGMLRAAVAIGLVLTVISAIGGYIGYTQLLLQEAHQQRVAASAAFCSTIRANPTMKQLPTFGWPAVAASIPDSLTAMQAYEDRWTKLVRLSPDEIRPEAQKIATEAKHIIDGVTVARTVHDSTNISAMSVAASASGVPGWYTEFCS
jgi:hypothetical protein